MNPVSTVDPITLQHWLAEDKAVLLDVREPMEYNREHITGALLAPLASLDPADFAHHAGKIIVCQCRSGARSEQAVQRLLAGGNKEVYTLEGGLEAWKQAGLPVHFDRKAPIDLMRQVQIIAGSLVLLGVILAVLVSPGFIILSGFVGAGLLFAGLTGFCGMAILLARMPWNRSHAPAPSTSNPLTS